MRRPRPDSPTAPTAGASAPSTPTATPAATRLTTFTFTVDTAAPNTPTLLTPANNSTITSNPTFTWSNESASGATKYDLQYVIKGATCDFTGATTVNDIVGTSYTPPPIADGTYCWHVRSTDAVGNKSAYQAAPFTFTKAAADSDGDGIPNTVDCTTVAEDIVVDPNNVTGLPPARRFNTLQAAVNAAQDNYAIGMYANTTENVVIGPAPAPTRTC